MREKGKLRQRVQVLVPLTNMFLSSDNDTNNPPLSEDISVHPGLSLKLPRTFGVHSRNPVYGHFGSQIFNVAQTLLSAQDK